MNDKYYKNKEKFYEFILYAMGTIGIIFMLLLFVAMLLLGLDHEIMEMFMIVSILCFLFAVLFLFIALKQINLKEWLK